MAILPIPKVVPDTDILADHFNRMADAIGDVAAGHEHNGENYHGKPVDHDHLVHAGVYQHDRVAATKVASIDQALDMLFAGTPVDATYGVRALGGALLVQALNSTTPTVKTHHFTGACTNCGREWNGWPSGAGEITVAYAFVLPHAFASVLGCLPLITNPPAQPYVYQPGTHTITATSHSGQFFVSEDKPCNPNVTLNAGWHPDAYGTYDWTLEVPAGSLGFVWPTEVSCAPWLSALLWGTK